MPLLSPTSSSNSSSSNESSNSCSPITPNSDHLKYERDVKLCYSSVMEGTPTSSMTFSHGYQETFQKISGGAMSLDLNKNSADWENRSKLASNSDPNSPWPVQAQKERKQVSLWTNEDAVRHHTGLAENWEPVKPSSTSPEFSIPRNKTNHGYFTMPQGRRVNDSSATNDPRKVERMSEGSNSSDHENAENLNRSYESLRAEVADLSRQLAMALRSKDETKYEEPIYESLSAYSSNPQEKTYTVQHGYSALQTKHGRPRGHSDYTFPSEQKYQSKHEEIQAMYQKPQNNSMLGRPRSVSLRQPGAYNQSQGLSIGSAIRHQIANAPPAIPKSLRKIGPCLKSLDIVYRFGSTGTDNSQFNNPHGFCVGENSDIVVADTNNHRVQIFTNQGLWLLSFGNAGRSEGNLWYPRKIAYLRCYNYIVVCDRGKDRSRMQLFSYNGMFIKKLCVAFADIVAGITANNDTGEIVIIDSVKPTCFVISIEGEGSLRLWFDCSPYMIEPSDVAAWGGKYYICDFKGHRICVFDDAGQLLSRLGGESITDFPNGIVVTQRGQILVGDSHGNRMHVAVLAQDGDLEEEYECQFVKVSRCCGLGITNEGDLVTLAKNSNFAIVVEAQDGSLRAKAEERKPVMV